MKTTHHALFVGLALVALASAASAQGQRWIRQFGTSSDDGASGVAPDGSGGSYACGTTTGSFGGPAMGAVDVWIERRDGAGHPLWTLQLGTPQIDWATSAAPDGAGGVYVCGWTTGALAGPLSGSRDAFVARFDGAGNQLWMHQLALPGDEMANAMAPDGAGGVFVCGQVAQPSAYFIDSWIARFDAAGNQLFFQVQPTQSFTKFLAAASDGSGGVWVSGRNTYVDPSLWVGWDFDFVLHYDGAGNELANVALGNTNPGYLPSTNQWVHGLAPDGAGGVYVAGESGWDPDFGPGGGINDAWLAHYDAAAALVWRRSFATSADDTSPSAAADGSGGVYVAGVTFGRMAGSSTGAQGDAWLAHVDRAGNTLSLAQFGTTGHEWVHACAPDGLGGVLLGGSTDGDLGGPNAGGWDAWVARLP